MTGSRPRLLFLADRLSTRGGADRHLLGILDLLRGRVPYLLGVGFDDQSLSEKGRSRLGDWVRIKGLDRSGLNARGRQATLSRLIDLVRDFGPDLIHLQNIMDPEIIRAAADLRPTLITTQDHRFFCPGRGKVRADGQSCDRVMGDNCLECFHEQDYGQRMLDLTRIRLEALKGAAQVLVLSNYMAEELVRAGLDRNRISLNPPFVHGLAPITSEHQGHYHLMASRLVRRKGIRVALKAALEFDCGLPLVVAGDGSLAREVADLAKASADRLGFKGWQDRAGLKGLIENAASLWLPSLWAEPFGIVGLEALAFGVPVIATPVGGIPDWLADQVNGLLVPPGDPEALARAAKSLALDPGLRQRLGRAGQTLVNGSYTPRQGIEQFLRICDKIIHDQALTDGIKL